MLLLSLLQTAAAAAAPDTRAMFLVSVTVVTSVVVFTAGVVLVLVRRSDRRRAEEEKLAAIGTATARILHQIKNPLQTIVLHADILQDERIVSEASQRREVCEAIVGESQRLVDMLEELSVYASGAQRTLNPHACSLRDLLLQVAAAEQVEGADTGVRMDTSQVREAYILADPYYLRQAFENLVRNAREAMHGQPDAGIALSVEREGATAVVRVADNGPGIEPEKLERIFQPFVSTKGKGMGLGLAICREIVEGHGGRIAVQSTVASGTTFVIHLPLLAETAVPAPQEELIGLR